MEELIAKKYAKALSSVSTNVAEIAEVLNALTAAISTAEVKEVLLSPIVPNDKKTEMILSTLGDQKDTVLVNLIKILGENKRLNLIPAIAKVLNTDLQAASNKYDGVVKAKKKLDEKTLGNLEKALDRYTGSKIKLRQEKSDLDGLLVAVDDLGIEVNFSKQRVKEQLIDFIKKSL